MFVPPCVFGQAGPFAWAWFSDPFGLLEPYLPLAVYPLFTTLAWSEPYPPLTVYMPLVMLAQYEYVTHMWLREAHHG